MRRDWDYKNTIDFAHDKGFEEGLAEGEAQGRAEGLADGVAKGRTEEQRAIAKRLLVAGVSIELVAESTALPIEQVREMQDA